jgi:hypothetical protein
LNSPPKSVSARFSGRLGKHAFVGLLCQYRHKTPEADHLIEVVLKDVRPDNGELTTLFKFLATMYDFAKEGKQCMLAEFSFETDEYVEIASDAFFTEVNFGELTHSMTDEIDLDIIIKYNKIEKVPKTPAA